MEIGTQLGPYQILASLGSGGMGEVFRARDVRLGRDVAIKVLPEQFAQDPKRLARFEGEARALAALAHPNILVLHDFASHDGRAYAVMEVLEGETVRGRIASGPLPWRQAAEICAAVADGLSAAHAKGIIHRDLKPGNLFLTTDGQVKILDFGLARIQQPIDSKAATAPYVPRHTDAGTVVGTTGYMAPEQLRGQAVDARSDLFALGCVLYEMVAGCRAFKGDSRADVEAAVLREEPPSLSSRTSEVPQELERITQHCLEKKAERRFQSARDLAFSLRTLMADPEPSNLSPLPPPKRRALSWLSKALGLALFAAFLVYRVVREAPPPEPPPPKAVFASVAVLPFKNTSESPSESEHLADGITEALITKLAQLQLPNFRVTPSMTSERYKKSTKTLQEIAGEMRVDVLVTGTLRRSGQRIRVTISLISANTGLQSWGEQFDESLTDIFTLEQRIAVAMVTKLKGELTGSQQQTLAQAPSRSAEAYEYYLRGKREAQRRDKDANDLAYAFYQKAVNIDPELAEAYVGLGEAQWLRYYMGWQGELGNLQKAEEQFRYALNLKPELASAFSGLIRVHMLRGKTEECLKEGQKVASFARQDIATLMARADAYYYAGLYDRVIPLRKRVGELDPANPGARMAATFGSAGKFRESMEAGELELRKFGENARAHSMIGSSAFFLGELEKANAHYQASIKLAPDDYLAYRYLGIVYRQQNQPEKAKEIWRQGRDLVTRVLDAYPHNPRLRTHLAIFSGHLGDRATLLREEGRVLAEDAENGLLLTNLGVARAALGDTDKGIEFFRQSLLAGYLAGEPDEVYLKAVGLDHILQSAAYKQYRQEHNKERDRLQALY